MGAVQSSASLSTPLQRKSVFNGGKPSVEAIATLLGSGRTRNVVVVAGAGISVSAGIPDFRTPGTGLYANLQRFRLPRPEAIFDINFFARNPRPFFALAREMFPGTFDPTPTHFFLRLLAEKGVVRRIYTQNIDTLERIAGIPADVLVEAHGSYATSTCRKCGANYDLAWLRSKLLPAEQGAEAAPASSPASSSPADLSEVRMSTCDAAGCGGLVKPDITFFGEDLPARFHALVPGDVDAADMVVVMGTSLQVYPVGGIPFFVGPYVPRLLINREAVGLAEDYCSPAESDDDDDESGNAARAAALEVARAQVRAQISAAKAAARAAGRAAAAEAAAAAAPAEEAPAEEAVAEAEAEDDHALDAEVEEALAATLGGGQRGRTPAKFIFGRRGNYRDVHMAGDCDASVLKLAELLGWADELAALQARELERIHAERLGSFPVKATAHTTPDKPKALDSAVPASTDGSACGGAGAVALPKPKSEPSLSLDAGDGISSVDTGLAKLSL